VFTAFLRGDSGCPRARVRDVREVFVIGKTVAHYRILEKLGEGGMGIVYKAEDTKLKRAVALKFLPPEFTRDPEAKERFVREAQAASGLDHPNICTIHEINETEDGQMFISMACYEGESLEAKIARGPLKLDEALNIAIQVGEALSAAHDNEIVHRDIKPGNILTGKDGRAEVVDFGLAKLARGSKLTRAGWTTGTIAYMSPEQTRGEDVDHRADIWSFGVTLYEMLTGQRPFKGSYEQAVIYSIMNEEPEPITGLRTGVPVEFERIVAKAMAKRPAERYQHMDDLLVDLRTLRRKLEGTTDTVLPHPAARAPSAKRRFVRVGIPVIAALAVVLALVFVLPNFLNHRAVSAPTPIIVISFENQTGDTTYDYLREAIPNLLITNLERSRFLQVTTWERIRDLLDQLGRSEFELCRMEGVDAIVLGSFTKAGDMFATDVKVLDVDTKQLLASANSKGEGVGSILRTQIDELSRNISRGVGVPQPKGKQEEPAIAEVTTSSMEAYNHFLRGRAFWRKLYFDEALQSLEKAIEIDPTFAVAHLYLAFAHAALDNIGPRDEAIRSAMRFADGATEKEQLLIRDTYASLVERDEGKSLAILREMEKKFPREKIVYKMLGNTLRGLGRTDEAIAAYNRVLELDPNDGQTLNDLAYVYADLGDLDRALEYVERYASVLPGDANPLDTTAEMYFRMGRLDDAVAKYEQALAVKPDFGADCRIAYVHALREEYPAALARSDQYIATMPSGALAVDGHVWKALLRFWLGDLDGALDRLGTARGLAEAAEHTYWQDEVERMRAWMLYRSGETDRGPAFFESWQCPMDDPSYPPPPGDFYPSTSFHRAEQSFYLGLIDAAEGRVIPARSRLAEIESRAAEEGRRFKQWALLLRDALDAKILIGEGSVDQAIAIYKDASPPHVPMMWILTLVQYNLIFERDALARAYVRNGETDEAIAEYERLLRFDPESTDRRLIHPTYHYSLAKLYEEKGRSRDAVGEYETFLEIWKDADPSFPEPADARARLVALRTRVE
jgi:tetratricopeptide (TPR) repeat protein